MIRQREINAINQLDVYDSIDKKIHIQQTTTISFDPASQSTLPFQMKNILLQMSGKKNHKLKIHALQQFLKKPQFCKNLVLEKNSEKLFKLLFEQMTDDSVSLTNEQKYDYIKLIQKLKLNLIELQQLFRMSQVPIIQKKIVVNSIIKHLRLKINNHENMGIYCPLARQIIYELSKQQYDETFLFFIDFILKFDESRIQLINFTKDFMPNFLRSNNKLIKNLFQTLLSIQFYHEILIQFLLRLINENFPLEENFQVYIIQNMIEIITCLKIKNFDTKNIFNFLCLKLKSLRKIIRIVCLQTINNFPYVEKDMISIMIEKDILQKVPNHRRGIFLQLLEDEYHDVRILTIKCLKTFVLHYDKSQIKQILFYMINDEHDEVRLESVKALIFVSRDYMVTKQDLEIILMCLKQNIKELRVFTYKLIEIIQIKDENIFLYFIDRLVKVLKQYKEDKIYLYSVFRTLGNKYFPFIINNVKSILEIDDLESIQQPSWKNIIHKARIILIGNAFDNQENESIKKNLKKLPHYFLRHFQYIKDVEPYAFDQVCLKQSILDELKRINPMNKSEKVQFVKSQIVLWKQIIKQQKGIFENPYTIEHYFRRIFKILNIFYQIQLILKNNQFYEVRFQTFAVKILSKICKINNLYRCQNHTHHLLNLAKIFAFQYILLAELNPLKFNKSRISKISILNAKLINQFNSENFPNPQKLLQLEQINKKIMTNLSSPRSNITHLNLMSEFLRKNSFFDIAFQMIAANEIEKIKENKFKIFQQKKILLSESIITLRIEIQNQEIDLNNYILKVYAQNSVEMLKILEEDEVQVLVQTEETLKKIYQIKLPQKSKIQKIQTIKSTTETIFEGREDEEQFQSLIRLEKYNHITFQVYIVP